MIEFRGFARSQIAAKPAKCEAEIWFTPMMGPCFVCQCGADSVGDCKRRVRKAKKKRKK